MITEIPTSSDFQNAGINLLNLAWDSAISLLIERDIDLNEIINENSVNEAYWKSAQPILTSSLSLVQQGVEFFLKGKIAEVSQYLLIAGNPSSFPKNSCARDTNFSDFRTIDAQDLIRMHDTVSSNRLPEGFSTWYDELRKLRNKLMHTVDSTITIKDKDVLIKVMECCEYCIQSLSWINIRSQYLMNSPSGYLIQNVSLEHLSDNEKMAGRLGQLQCEIMTVVEYLEPQYSKKFLGFHKKQRRYVCLHCLSIRERGVLFEYKDDEEIWLNINTAQLVESDVSQRNIVHCIFCGGNYLIKREQCTECGNDIIDADTGRCLSCLIDT